MMHRRPNMWWWWWCCAWIMTGRNGGDVTTAFRAPFYSHWRSPLLPVRVPVVFIRQEAQPPIRGTPTTGTQSHHHYQYGHQYHPERLLFPRQHPSWMTQRRSFPKGGNTPRPVVMNRRGDRTTSSTDRSSSTGSTSRTRSTTRPTNRPIVLDPLVLEFSLQQQQPHFYRSSNNDTIWDISRGLAVWRRTLRKGQLPLPQDFHPLSDDADADDDDDCNQHDKKSNNIARRKMALTQGSTSSRSDTHHHDAVWPADPALLDSIYQRLVPLLRLLPRHSAVLLPLVLRVVLSLYYDNYHHHLGKHLHHHPGISSRDDPMSTTPEEHGTHGNEQDDTTNLHVDDDDDNRDAYAVHFLDNDDTMVTSSLPENNNNIYVQRLQQSVTMIQSLNQLFDPITTNQLLQEYDAMNDVGMIGIGGGGGDTASMTTTTGTGWWHHTGWKRLPVLQQQQLQQLPKLQQLMQSLGRRSTTTAPQNAKKFHSFRIRVEDANAKTTSAIPPSHGAPRDRISGLTRSNRYPDMLPTEAVLLLRSSTTASTSLSNHTKSINNNNNSPSVLRKLFYAKLVESQLVSYDFTGWTDAPTRRPKHKKQPPRYHRTPSSPGGPIIICLDTSYSMCDPMKESISKSIVLACVQAAHRQQRDCRVVAFGPKGTVMDAGDSILRADAIGLQNLLNFLCFSLGGGTDVTGALKYALTLLQSPENEKDEHDHHLIDMSAADLLLITDGEIPDPPVSEQMMEQLMKIQQQSEVQIHGILVGTTTQTNQNVNDGVDDDNGKSIKALEKICTHVHDFLLDYPVPPLSQQQRPRDRVPTSTSALRMMATSTKEHPYRNRALRTMTTSTNENPYHSRSLTIGQLRVKRTALLARRYNDNDDDDDDDIDFILAQGRSRRSSTTDEKAKSDTDSKPVSSSTAKKTSKDRNDDNERMPATNNLKDYHSRVENSVETIQNLVHCQLDENMWTPSILDDEQQNSKGSCWSYQSELREAIYRVGENLIERDIEARLVVLGMLAGEHVLLIGPPGTAKSALGRRLSKLCGGIFFQRLLTRFTTPEEIFGPLSLRALENDEYRRCTDGFLPTASVAFLDEIFKANSAILNTLLTILNERQFDNGAGRREECPIRCVIAASNELPESDELDALYDRFLLRKEVLSVSDEGVIQLLTIVSTPGVSPCDSDSDVTCDAVFADGLDRICDALSLAADQVHFDTDSSYLLRDLRAFLREELNVNISDRRLVKAARLLKISAATHGRTQVDPIDCLILQHIAWNLPEQRGVILEWLLDHMTPGSNNGGGSNSMQYNLLLNSLRQAAMTAVRRTTGALTKEFGASESDVTVIETVRLETSQLVTLLQAESDTLLRHIELLRRSRSYLWLDPDETLSLEQQMIPVAERAWNGIFRTLRNASALEVVLTSGSDTETSVSNDIRLSVMEQLWGDEDFVTETMVNFTDTELNMSMKEAKSKYTDGDMFRRWKRERKKAGIK